MKKKKRVYLHRQKLSKELTVNYPKLKIDTKIVDKYSTEELYEDFESIKTIKYNLKNEHTLSKWKILLFKFENINI